MIRHLHFDELDLIRPALISVQALHHDARPDLFRAPQDTIDEAIRMLGMMMQNDGLVVLGAEKNTKLTGFLSYDILEQPERPFRQAERTGWLHHISVLPEYQRQGVATRLVNRMTSELARQHITRWTVSYWNFNAASAALMARVGAKPYQIFAEARI